MAVQLVSVTPSSLSRALAAFSGPVDPVTVSGGQAWGISTGAGNQPVTVVDAVVRAGDQDVDLYLSTRCSPGQTYTAECPGAKDPLGGDVVPDSVNFQAPVINNPALPEWPHGLLRSYTRAVAQEVQAFCGEPVTLLLRDLVDGDTVAFVESTLGLEAAGAVYIRGRRFTYTSRTDCSLSGLTPAFSDGQTLPAGSEVVCDARAVVPD